MTTEEIKTVIAEAETAGVLEADERRMISGVMRLGDRPVKGIMTPRSDVDWIDLQADDADIRNVVASYRERGGSFRVVTSSDENIVGCGGLYAIDER